MAHLVAPVMGTTVSIDVRDPGVGREALDAALDRLCEIEARFSTYRPDSEISRIDRGDLDLADAHPEVREVLAACDVLRAQTGGAFDARYGGRIDPSGYVKGWAGSEAAGVLRARGATRFMLNLGGDIVCAGEPEPGLPWRVGVRDPADPGRMMLVLGVRDGAVATSGRYERGDHLLDPRIGGPATRWDSITVMAPDLATADAFATAAFVMGESGPGWVAAQTGCGVAAAAGGRLLTSDLVDRATIRV